MFFEIEYIGVHAIENYPFYIDRPDGSYRYFFFHFISQVTMELNNETITVSPGSCIIYEPRVAQKFYVLNNRLNHDYIDFTVSDESFFKTLNLPLNTILNPKIPTYISETLEKIRVEKTSGIIGNQYLIEGLMMELFVQIARNIHRRHIANTDKYTDELKVKFENIRLNMFLNPESLSVNSLADSLGFSLSRFNTLYKSFFGVSPISDLTKARIELVKELVKDNVSTKEIIRRIGFSSEEYYYRWFKKHFHMTKEEYIKHSGNMSR